MCSLRIVKNSNTFILEKTNVDNSFKNAVDSNFCIWVDFYSEILGRKVIKEERPENSRIHELGKG